MKIVCDTNIFIDVILKQYPFFDSSFEILKLGLEKVIEIYVAATSVNDIYYIIASRTHNKETAYNAIGKIFEIASICPVTEKEIREAHSRNPYDFEDCIITVCAPLEFLEQRNLSL